MAAGLLRLPRLMLRQGPAAEHKALGKGFCLLSPRTNLHSPHSQSLSSGTWESVADACTLNWELFARSGDLTEGCFSFNNNNWCIFN